MTRVAVVDFGTGNLRSVQKAIEHVDPGTEVAVTGDARAVERADRVVFPGQGAMGTCMRSLETGGLRGALIEAIADKPFLGICLGLQALFEYSEEDGGTEGLGILAGDVRHFKRIDGMPPDLVDPTTGVRLKIPHMGWNTVRQVHDHPLWEGIPQDSRFYFVHSYCALAARSDQVYGVTEYGRPFTSVAGRGNVFAVQFHPEKSQHVGLQLLKNFLFWNGSI